MYWWVLDIIIAALLILGFFVYYRKGLLAAAVGIIGAIASLLIAFWASEKLTPFVYDNFVENKLGSFVQEKLVDGGSDYLSGLLGTDVDLSGITGTGGEDGVEGEKTGGIIGETVASNARNIVRTVLAIIIFALALLITRLLARLLRRANDVPLLGSVNKLFGGVLGLAMGALWCYIFVSVCALIIKVSMNSLGWLNSDMVDKSILFSLIYPYNLLNALASA